MGFFGTEDGVKKPEVNTTLTEMGRKAWSPRGLRAWHVVKVCK